MRGAYLQICKLLACSGLRDREVAEFAHILQQNGPDAFLEDIVTLRRWINGFASERFYDSPSFELVSPPSEVSEKIERLLIHEAGMPKSIAVSLLSADLRQRYPDLPFPSESRKGFRTWIDRLGDLLPGKELLHVATSLRNRYVHESPPDWRLK
jgi:hypothetical protein